METDDREGGPFDACAFCGDSFDHGVSYPVVVRDCPHGGLDLYSFCDGRCRAAWREGR